SCAVPMFVVWVVRAATPITTSTTARKEVRPRLCSVQVLGELLEPRELGLGALEPREVLCLYRLRDTLDFYFQGGDL
ncbi:hypothetical protein C0991_011798, partial [Blastosporella zonata]